MTTTSDDTILSQLDSTVNGKKADALTQDTNAIVAFVPRKQKNAPIVTPVEHAHFVTKRESRKTLMGKKNRIFPKGGDRKPTEVDIEMEKFAASGIDLENVTDEFKQSEVMETIRALPCNMMVKVMLREKLFAGPVRGLSTWESWKYQVSRSWKKFRIHSREVMYSIELWGSSFRGIEGHQGTGVLSYFVFLRWLFGLNFVLFLLLFGFITVPMILQPAINYSGTSTDTAVNLSYYCTELYILNISTNAAELILDFIQGTGYMEKTYLFYGFYSGTQFLTGSGVSSSYVYNVPLAYFLVAVVCLLVSLFLMAKYTARGFRESIMDERENGNSCSNKVFASWDYSLSDAKTAKIKHNSIHYDIVSDLAEERFDRERGEKLKDGCKRFKLYFVRFLVNGFVLACLAAGGYVIFYVTTWSSRYVASNSSATGTSAYILLVVQYMPSIMITVLNAAIPIVFNIIVKAEQYTQDFVVKITLIRTVFLRLASLAVLVVSLYTDIICDPRDSCLTNQAPCTVIKCWETYVGQQMYKLVILNFLVTVIKVFLVELPRKLVVHRCRAKLFQIIGPPEFQIAQNVLDLIYTQTVCWLGFFFAPLIPAMIVIHLFVLFYAKLLSALVACEPSKRPYRASRSNSFFMMVLLLAFFLCCVPVGYTMAALPPSKGCGPFRIYSMMYSVIQYTVAAWPDIAETIYNVATSAAVTASIIILLCLLVYYCSALKGAHIEKTKTLMHQLKVEGQDKRFLLARLQEVAGETTPILKGRRTPRGVSQRPDSGSKRKPRTRDSQRSDTRLNIPPEQSNGKSPHPNQPADDDW
ncbi:transmembrane channel-like protein 7 isoform X1 [Haliotis rufescens]|uniref:transmembrane channel-like protein 7 isoform X1 n=1 Tax=Haliotis rufescens TaxID=6454 RepID=UPI00201FA082|nr:transmembrane channel-like protein 7 isoform X1 [Haliotis rufescens]